MSRKPTLQEGLTTWGAIVKTRCFCGHVMSGHQRWANQVVCLEMKCHGMRAEDVPEGETAVRICWDFEETNDDV